MQEIQEKEKLKKNKRKKELIIFFLTVFLGFPWVVWGAYEAAFWKRVYPKVSVCQIDLSGKTKSQAKEILENYLKKNFPREIVLESEEKKFSLSPTFISYSLENTLENVFKIGREKNFFAKIKKRQLLLTKGEEIGFFLKLEGYLWETEVASIAGEIYVPAVEPQLRIKKEKGSKQIEVETGKAGKELNFKSLNQLLMDFLACPQEKVTLRIPVVEIKPHISAEQAEKVKERAEKLLDKKIILKTENQSWALDEEVLISFLDFYGNGFNKEKIKNYTQELAEAIKTEPKNATFVFEEKSNKVTVFEPSKPGIRLKNEQASELILRGLQELETQTQVEINLPLEYIQAEIETDDVNNLGIKELVGEGSSLFKGSIPERIHNIDLARLRISGTLIPPGQVFSFNKTLGEVSAKTGYKQAYIIKEGRTVLGDGGGVCQVSTTLFRAALNAGLPILERHAHAYRVHYYEDDLGPGFDATVYDPNYDLKFENNTPGYLLIQSEINLKTKGLIFRLYGTKDGRKVEISKARVWDVQPPPPDLYQDDPTLPAGVIKQIDWKAWGAKVAFEYKVTLEDEVLFQKTFTSYYKPWQAVYLRGTKTN